MEGQGFTSLSGRMVRSQRGGRCGEIADSVACRLPPRSAGMRLGRTGRHRRAEQVSAVVNMRIFDAPHFGGSSGRRFPWVRPSPAAGPGGPATPKRLPRCSG